MEYREYAPSRPVAGLVECFWSLRAARAGSGATPAQRVLPDGCLDLLFDVTEARPEARLVGTMTRAVVVPTRAGVRLIAVRFRPGGATPFFRLPLARVTDLDAPLIELWPDGEALLERLAGLEHAQAQARALEAALIARLPAAREPDPRVAGAVRLLGEVSAHGGSPSVAQVAAAVGLTRQHLTRLFDEAVGVGPKVLARVLRLRRLVKRASSAPPDWAELAVDAGYYDQAHMAGEFREMVGLTPGQWTRERSGTKG